MSMKKPSMEKTIHVTSMLVILRRMNIWTRTTPGLTGKPQWRETIPTGKGKDLRAKRVLCIWETTSSHFLYWSGLNKSGLKKEMSCWSQHVALWSMKSHSNASLRSNGITISRSNRESVSSWVECIQRIALSRVTRNWRGWLLVAP